VTGTYAVQLEAFDASRNITGTFSISAANTWEQKTITFDGDTAGSGITNDNGRGICVEIYLAAGTDYTSSDSTSWGAFSNARRAFGQAANAIGTTGSFYLTAVQLEVGNTATPFEHRSFGDELAMCQRYYYKKAEGNAKDLGSGTYYTANLFAFSVSFPVTMRAAPVLDYVSGTGFYGIFSNGALDQFDAMTGARLHENGGALDTSTGTSGTVGQGGVVTTNNTASYFAFSSEL